MKNKDTGDVLFVVVFTLLKKEDVDKVEVEKAEETQREAGEKIELAKEGGGEANRDGGGGGGGDDDVD